MARCRPQPPQYPPCHRRTVRAHFATFPPSLIRDLIRATSGPVLPGVWDGRCAVPYLSAARATAGQSQCGAPVCGGQRPYERHGQNHPAYGATEHGGRHRPPAPVSPTSPRCQANFSTASSVVAPPCSSHASWAASGSVFEASAAYLPIIQERLGLAALRVVGRPCVGAGGLL